MRIAAVVLAATMMLAIVGCSSPNTTSDGKADYAPVRIGTMPTEDFLPMWAAEKDGLFAEAGVDAELLSFDSAQALSAAISAGEVDMAMVDVPRAVKLCESGTPVVMEWVTLGTEASQGAFGVMAAADAPYDTLEEFAAYVASNNDKWATAGVGVAANTVPEYVYERLLEQAGVDPSTIPVQEVASLPERYSLMATGNLSAAALPASMLRFGEASGLKLLAEDTKGDNVSQSVMIATASFASDNDAAILKVADAWDAAVNAIAADPGAYGMLLAEKANLNDAVADTYPIADYPLAQNAGTLAHPLAALVNPQLQWMLDKGYSTHAATYDETTGTITVE